MIYIAADRHGYRVIKLVERYLKANKIRYQNMGVTTAKEDMRLEDFTPRVIQKVRKGKNDEAILSCGTGIGVEVGANKFAGVRACLARDAELAKWSRVYDKCNVLCLVGWGTKKKEVDSILGAWFSAKYDGDGKRLKMFKAFDKWH